MREKFKWKNFFGFWLTASIEKTDAIPVRFRGMKNHTILVFSALLGAIAGIFQSAGGLFLGIGYLISPLSTAPIILSTVLSVRYGFMAYLITIVLLSFLQPSEMLIFPFTTGLLGLSIGIGFSIFKRRGLIAFFASLSLFSGILTLIAGFHFPILGPIGSQSVSFSAIGGIYLFCLIYSTFWIELYLYFSK